jgi:uncharacterized membrane protein YccC
MIAGILGWAAGTVLLVGLTFAFLGMTGRVENGTEYFYGCLCLANVGDFIASVLQRSWSWAAFGAVFAVFFGWVWWHERRKRKNRRRVADALGAKSKALRDAIVQRAREAMQPRPVLRSNLGGAR